ncbi:MAG: SH3 domain-containing protein [Chloroflexi bacterium]|nr:SH3 domain-containing protein [Chloroflexota bacterium]
MGGDGVGGGLLFLGLYALLPEASQASPEPVATPQTTPESIETVLSSPAGKRPFRHPSSPTPAPFPESQVTVLPTNPPPPTQTTVPTATPSPEPQTAVVASGVGVYLREQPSVTAPDLEWLLKAHRCWCCPEKRMQMVTDGYWCRTPEGNEGWVATDFIEITP